MKRSKTEEFCIYQNVVVVMFVKYFSGTRRPQSSYYQGITELLWKTKKKKKEKCLEYLGV